MFNSKIMKLLKYIFLVLIAVFSSITLEINAQTQLSNYDDGINIPLLDSLFISAYANSPVLDYYENEIQIGTLNLKSHKFSWLDHVAFDSYIRYGLLDNLTLQEGSTNFDNIKLSSTNKQTRYAAGLSINIPISKITNQKTESKRLILEIEKTKNEHRKIRNAIQQKVIDEYYEIIKAEKIFKILSSESQNLNILMLKAEKDYSNGKILFKDLLGIKEKHTRIQIELETTLINLKVSIKRLEKTTGLIFSSRII